VPWAEGAKTRRIDLIIRKRQTGPEQTAEMTVIGQTIDVIDARLQSGHIWARFGGLWDRSVAA
jgi:hypothetical protein